MVKEPEKGYCLKVRHRKTYQWRQNNRIEDSGAKNERVKDLKVVLINYQFRKIKVLTNGDNTIGLKIIGVRISGERTRGERIRGMKTQGERTMGPRAAGVPTIGEKT